MAWAFMCAHLHPDHPNGENDTNQADAYQYQLWHHHLNQQRRDNIDE